MSDDRTPAYAKDIPTERPRGSWGGPPADDDVSVDELVGGVDLDELQLEGTYLDEDQHARIEALQAARELLLQPGSVFGLPHKLEPWALGYLADYILKGADEADEDTCGTDAEQEAPTDGGGRAPQDLVE